jgi:predicted nucleic acid-binding protein
VAVVYFDSSAFVKLLVEEDGSDTAASLWDGADAVVSSRLAYPEVMAALSAAARDHRLGAAAHRSAEAAWQEYWSATRVVELTDVIATEAGRLAGHYALRGADALHIASALAVGVGNTLFAVWDARLRHGAESARLLVVPAG